MENPKIRFKGFTKDWEQRKLGDDLVSIHTGTNLLGSITNTGMPLIKMGNIQRGYFDTSKVEFLAENEQPDKADIVNYGDFFFNTRNTLELVGKGATWMKNSGEYAFNSNIARFELRNLDTIFFNYLYNTDYMTKQIHARAMGTTSVAAIYPRTLDSVEYLAPCMKEQQKIGAYFKQLDHLITLHQRKCEQTKKLKKYMLQKMFPQNGAKVPEIRFDGFTYDWEQRKAIDIADYSKGNGYSKGDLTDAGTPIILYGRLYTKYQFAISEVDTFAVPRNGAVYSQGNEVIVPASGETAEDIARASAVEKSGVLLGGDLNILRPFDFINPLFLALAISNGEPQKELAKKAQGKSVVHIHNTDIQEVTIAYPSRTEQDRIVSVFRQLDNLITLHQRKCDELKKMKKFMLQNMFI